MSAVQTKRRLARRQVKKRPRYSCVHKIAQVIQLLHNPHGECPDWYLELDTDDFECLTGYSQGHVSKSMGKLLGVEGHARPFDSYLRYFIEKRVRDLYDLAVNCLLDVGLDYREKISHRGYPRDCWKLIDRRSTQEFLSRRWDYGVHRHSSDMQDDESAE